MGADYMAVALAIGEAGAYGIAGRIDDADMSGAAGHGRVTRCIAHLVGENAVAKQAGKRLAMGGAGLVGRPHGQGEIDGARRACVLVQGGEEAEAISDQRTARRGRRVERHDGTPVAPEKRCAALHAIGAQILACQIAAKGGRLSHDRLADVAIHEQPRAVLGEPFERLGEAGIAEGVARLEQPAFRREDPPRAVARHKDRRDHREQIGLELREREALAGRAHRGLHQPPHGQPAEVMMEREETRHDARRGA